MPVTAPELVVGMPNVNRINLADITCMNVEDVCAAALKVVCGVFKLQLSAAAFGAMQLNEDTGICASKANI